MDAETLSFLNEFKTLVDNQNFTRRRVEMFESLFEQFKSVTDLNLLKEIMLEKLERVFKFQLIKNKEVIYKKNEKIDKICESLLLQSNVEFIDLVPVQISGDGNCLYRSISQALYGSQNFHFEIRYRTLVDMVFNRHYHLSFLNSYTKPRQPNWFLVCAPGSDNLDLSQTYDEQIFECSRLSHFSTIIHVYVAAQALKIHIDQIYPSKCKLVEGSLVAFLNKTMECNFYDVQGLIKIVWSNASSDNLSRSSSTWNPNHFVCMVPYKKNYYQERLSEIYSRDKRELSINSQKIEDSEKQKKKKKNLSRSSSIESINEFLKSLPKISPYSSLSDKDRWSKNYDFDICDSVFTEESFDDKSSDIIDEKSSKSSISSNSRSKSLIDNETDVEFASLKIAELSIDTDICQQGVDLSELSGDYDSANFFVYDSFEYAFSQESVKCLPKSIRKNCIFCVDLNMFSIGDTLADNNGAYRQYGNVTKFYEIVFEKNNLNVRTIKPYYLDKTNFNIYRVTKTFYRSIIKENFRRKTFRIKRINDNAFDKLVVCYINPDEKSFNLKCHGNARKITRPYIKKSNSCLKKIKEVSTKSGSALLKYAQLLLEVGENPELCEIPSSVSQIYKHKSIIQNKNNRNVRTRDEYADALINRKKSDFVRTFNFDRDSVQIVMFTDQQYRDIIRFGTSEGNFSILNVDTTFNLGRYYVTLITYRNLSLYHSGSINFPTFIGPIMIHLNKDYQSYHRFAVELKNFDKMHDNILSKIKCFITDDDDAIRGAFQQVFKNSEYMFCCNHLRKNLYRQFYQFDLEDEEKVKLIETIFGKLKNRKESLIGSGNKETFNERCNNLIRETKEIKHNFRITVLSEWLKKHLLNKIYKNFLKIIWKHDCAANDYYTTNDIEGINHKLKELSQRKQMSLSKIFDKLICFRDKNF
ncbi:unnamed protein product [Brachionus calyciflorus]|uniref:OTU domain-containing protein n=1 Tax=Brachionus calyciflorus TaxID=104777 RepID=A0A814MI99_9BILA|nr:unnamed protein product [Brachionus calyciflorus]